MHTTGKHANVSGWSAGRCFEHTCGVDEHVGALNQGAKSCVRVKIKRKIGMCITCESVREHVLNFRAMVYVDFKLLVP